MRDLKPGDSSSNTSGLSDGFLINGVSLASLKNFGTSPDFMEEFTVPQISGDSPGRHLFNNHDGIGQGGMIWILYSYNNHLMLNC